MKMTRFNTYCMSGAVLSVLLLVSCLPILETSRALSVISRDAASYPAQELIVHLVAQIHVVSAVEDLIRCSYAEDGIIEREEAFAVIADELLPAFKFRRFFRAPLHLLACSLVPVHAFQIIEVECKVAAIDLPC